jgi:hypothetical protein
MKRLALAAAGGALALAGCGELAAERAADTKPATWEGFGAGHWPPSSWRPYSDKSPFNTRFAPGAKALPGSSTMIGQVLRYGPPQDLTAGFSQTPDDWGHPTYYASSDDPVFTLRTTAGYGRNPIEGARIRVPDRAQAAGGGDAHMTIVQPDGWEYDLWRVQDKPAGGGTLSFGWGGRLRIDGSGLGNGGTASKFGNLAGVIRAPELAAGRIDHALFVVLRCTGDGTAYGSGTRRRANDESAYVYPATAGGSPCPAGTPAPPMGARLRLAMSGAQIKALGRPAWQTAILLALARYGGYVGDTGGDGVGFMFESSTMYTSLGYPDPLDKVARGAGLRDHGGGRYAFEVGDGVDWARYLQVMPKP